MAISSRFFTDPQQNQTAQKGEQLLREAARGSTGAKRFIDWVLDTNDTAAEEQFTPTPGFSGSGF